jgi:hypothetical protein
MPYRRIRSPVSPPAQLTSRRLQRSVIRSMPSIRFSWTVGFVAAVLGGSVGLAIFCLLRITPEPTTDATDRVTTSPIHPHLEIDTNAVLVDVLESVSDTVARLKLPLATPLTPDKVRSFETRPVLLGRPSSLRSELVYEGGYEFRHQDSIVFELRTPDSIRKSAVPGIPSLRPGFDRDTFRTNVLLAQSTFKAALRRLGHTNLALLDTDPSVLDRLSDWIDSSPPRWFLTWYGGGAVEVDAETLAVKHYVIPIEMFGREPWPTTLTHSRPATREDSAESAAPDWSELRIEAVDRDRVIALIGAVLPEAREFCAQIGPPFPTRFRETDLDLKESMAGLRSGRIWLRLRLKSGFTISFNQGHVVGVRTPDAVIDGNYPEQDGMVRHSEEYRGPIRVSPEQAVARVLDVAMHRLGLPRKALWLDTEPEFLRTVNPTQTNGLRRYVIHWQRPETDEERERRMYFRWPRDASVWGEVDAVSGELKSFVAGGAALTMPDPVTRLPHELPDQPRE